MVQTSSDVAELNALLRPATGQLAWARRGVADEVLLCVGDPDATTGNRWRVGTQASDWVLGSPSGVLAGASASASEIDAALSRLEGREVIRLEATGTLALVVVFHDDTWLEIEGFLDASTEEPDDPPYWEVFAPDDALLRAGPGPIWIAASDSTIYPHAQPIGVPDHVRLANLSDDEILKLWGELATELHRRGIVRSPRQVADLAEELVRRHFNGFRGTYAQAGWDVLAANGDRLAVKAVTRRQGKLVRPIMVHPGQFDALLVVLFAEDLTVEAAWRIPREVVVANSRQTAKANWRRLRLSDVVKEPSVIALNI
jgi:hypothetical protein